MPENNRVLVVFFSFLLFSLLCSVSVFAAEFNAIPTELELKSEFENEWDSSIVVQDNDKIDIRLTVFLGVSGTDPPDAGQVAVHAEIWGLSQEDNWELLFEAETQRPWIETGEETTISWFDVFTVSDFFEEYRIEGFVRTGADSEQSINAYITEVVKKSRCGDIEINVHNVFLSESDSETVSFNIINESEETFFVDSVYFYESNSYFSLQEKDFDEEIDAGEVGDLKFKVVSNSVSENKSGNATVKVSGHFDSLSCSYEDIGEKSFSVTVQNDGTASTSACNGIRLFAFPAVVPENSTKYKTFSIVNETDNRFFVKGAEVETGSGIFSVFNDFFDSAINPFSEGKIRIRINSNGVSSSQAGNADIKIRGEFENGTDCSFAEIGSRSFSVTVEPEQTVAACGLFFGEVYDIIVGEFDSREFVYRLQNNSGKRFDIDDVLLTDSSEFELEKISAPSAIEAYAAGEFRLKVTTGSFSQAEQTVFATIKIKGEFENGLDCDFTDLSGQIKIVLSDEKESNEDNDNSAGLCSEIELKTEKVELGGGENVIQEFFIENDSEETFFVDGIEAYDYSSGISVTPDSFDSWVLPDGKASVWVNVLADNTSSNRKGTGFLKVKGHFSGNQNCSYSSIGTKSFSIEVNPGTGSSYTSGSFTAGSCSPIIVSVPAAKQISQSGSVSFTVNNPTGQHGFVVLIGANLTVSPNTFSVLPHSENSFSANVQYYIQGSTRLEYKMVGENCQGITKYTEIFSSAKDSITASAAPQESGSILVVNAPSQVVFAKRTTVIATIKNNTDVYKTIQTRLDGFSPNWSSDSVTLGFNPKETKTVFLDVFSNNNIGSFTGTIIIESDSERIQKALQLSSVEILGFGNDFLTETTVERTAANSVEITSRFKSMFSQQARGSASLETIDNAILTEKTFIINPNTTRTLVFGLQAESNQPLPEKVNIRIVLDDGRSSVETVLISDTGGFKGFGVNGFGSFLVFLGADEWTWGLLVLLVLLVAAIVWAGHKQPRQPYQEHTVAAPLLVSKSVSGIPEEYIQPKGPKIPDSGKVINEEVPSDKTDAKTVTTETTTTTVQKPVEAERTGTKLGSNNEDDRFWFLQE